MTACHPMTIEEKKTDDTQAMMAHALTSLFNLRKSGKRQAGAPVKTEFFERSESDKLVKEWNSFKESVKPAGRIARYVLSVFNKSEYNEIAERVSRYIPEEERRPEDYIREGAATVLRKIRIDAVTRAEDIVVSLENCAVDHFVNTDSEDEAREAIKTFSQQYLLAPGPEVFWAELIWFVRNVIRTAMRWIREIRQRRVPAVMLRCVDLIEWFRFDREVEPEREPRTSFREARRY